MGFSDSFRNLSNQVQKFFYGGEKPLPEKKKTLNREHQAAQAPQDPLNAPYMTVPNDPAMSAFPDAAPQAYYPGNQNPSQAYYPGNQSPSQAYYPGNQAAPQPNPNMQQTSPVNPYMPPAGISPQARQFMGAENPAPRQRRTERVAELAREPESNITPFSAPAENKAQETPKFNVCVLNVTDIVSCRSAMSYLRQGYCTITVMDRVPEKEQIRTFVDMLSGASFALGGRFTRLSDKSPIYMLAPEGINVYLDNTANPAYAQNAQASYPQQAARPNYQTPRQPYNPPNQPTMQDPYNQAYAGYNQAEYGAYQPQNYAPNAPYPQADNHRQSSYPYTQERRA